MASPSTIKANPPLRPGSSPTSPRFRLGECMVPSWLDPRLHVSRLLAVTVPPTSPGNPWASGAQNACS